MKRENVTPGLRVVVKNSALSWAHAYRGYHGRVEHVDPRSELYPIAVRLDGYAQTFPFDARELKLESR